MSAELPKLPEPTSSNIRAAIEEGATPYAGELIFLPSELDAFVARIRQEAARQAMERRWISVEERLPPPFEDVLIYPRPTDYCCEGQADMKGQWTYSDYEPYNGDVKHRINPTHWMPLPPPPAQLARAADAGGKEG